VIEPDRFYTPTEVRQESHAPREMVYTALHNGELKALRRGRRWLIPGHEALEWIRKVAA
jgi:excisionase family DNA binding protein